jgi:F0F1-type ATP synthase, gamma subunit
MQSIKDTMKITSAMYMISSSKMQKAKKSLADTEPFFFAQQNAVARFMKSVPDTNNIFFGRDIPDDRKKRGYLVITADKGLAGAYNHNVLKLASEQLEKGGQNKLFVVGELGRQYFMKKDVNIDGEFSYTVQNPTLYRARHIGLQLIDEYIREELDEVYIIYTKMINAFKMEADMFQLLPLQREEYTHKNLKGYSERMTFHPSVESVLNSLIPNVVCGFVYGALVESYASEHNSRMMAMQTATDCCQADAA